MTTFDERARAFESRFAQDQEAAFRARARRMRDLGLWAAQRLGRVGDEADAYADEVLAASVGIGGAEAAVGMVGADLRRQGVTVTVHEIRRRADGDPGGASAVAEPD